MSSILTIIAIFLLVHIIINERRVREEYYEYLSNYRDILRIIDGKINKCVIKLDKLNEKLDHFIEETK